MPREKHPERQFPKDPGPPRGAVLKGSDVRELEIAV